LHHTIHLAINADSIPRSAGRGNGERSATYVDF
jgi:hypothetical protein